ncbi:MAG: hypothetical protein VX693_05265 [Pseudomonadota bacterium]|nr:hypothetical protein [Pseudomonadota bacterium]
MLAIDLYNLVVKGGPKPPHEIISQFPSTCGKFAHDAINPIVDLLKASRQAKLPIYYVTGLFSSNRLRSTKRAGTRLTKDDYEIYSAFAPNRMM